MSAVALPLPDPPLTGVGFVLRPWAPADAAALAAAWADPEVVRWTAVPATRDEAAARRWIEGEARRRRHGLSLDLVVDAGGRVAGEVGLAAFDGRRRRAEVGWWIAAEWRRRRLATQAVAALSAWAVAELDLDRLVARCHPDNRGAHGVARGAGFVPDPDPAGARPGEVVWCYPAPGGTGGPPAGGTVPT